ncbi:helix-turn-helix domain-containing protein [Calditrichota bacterium]
MSPERRSADERKYPEVGTIDVRKQIGKEIKSAREFLQLDLDDVRALIKINSYYLQSIEEGNWSFLPPTYVKAFVKSYAEAVKLSAEKINPRIDEMFKDVLSSSIQLRLQNERDNDPPQGGVNDLMLWAERNRSILFYGALVVVIFILIIIFLLPKEEKSDPSMSSLIKPGVTEEIQPTRKDTATTVVAEQVTDHINKVNNPVSKPVMGQLDSYRLRIQAIDTCYVKLAIGDSVLYERTLWPGNSVTRELTETVATSLGNVFGVIMTVNGDTLPSFSGTRRVRRINIGRDGLE